MNKIPRVVTPAYTQMVVDLKKDPADIHVSLNVAKCDMIHMAMGICTETAELLVAIEMRSCTPHYISAKNIMEELGDAQFYIEGMCQIFNFPNDPVQMANMLDQDGLESYKGFEYVPDEIVESASIIAHAGGIMDYVKRVAIYNKEGNRNVPLYHLCWLINRLSALASLMVDDEKHVFAANEEKLLKGKNARYKEGKYSDAAAQARSDKEPSNPFMPKEPVPIKKHEEPESLCNVRGQDNLA